jgi:triacylglycerol esterase/lipase EstA (alpha/beta hydrolase family)
VHGILGQRALYWNVFRARLERDGFLVEEVAFPGFLLGDLRRAAETLREEVEAMARTGHPEVDLVCHSAGGLVARHYVQSMGGDAHVRHVVMLGTPHRGTYFAYATGLPIGLAAQARPGSAVLAALDEAPWPRHVRATNLWSPVDGIVIPGERSVWAQAENVKVWTHHWAFLVSRRVYDHVKGALLKPARKPRPPPGPRPPEP